MDIYSKSFLARKVWKELHISLANAQALSKRELLKALELCDTSSKIFPPVEFRIEVDRQKGAMYMIPRKSPFSYKDYKILVAATPSNKIKSLARKMKLDIDSKDNTGLILSMIKDELRKKKAHLDPIVVRVPSSTKSTLSATAWSKNNSGSSVNVNNRSENANNNRSENVNNRSENVNNRSEENANNNRNVNVNNNERLRVPVGRNNAGFHVPGGGNNAGFHVPGGNNAGFHVPGGNNGGLRVPVGGNNTGFHVPGGNNSGNYRHKMNFRQFENRMKGIKTVKPSIKVNTMLRNVYDLKNNINRLNFLNAVDLGNNSNDRIISYLKFNGKRPQGSIARQLLKVARKYDSVDQMMNDENIAPNFYIETDKQYAVFQRAIAYLMVTKLGKKKGAKKGGILARLGFGKKTPKPQVVKSIKPSVVNVGIGNNKVNTPKPSAVNVGEPNMLNLSNLAGRATEVAAKISEMKI